MVARIHIHREELSENGVYKPELLSSRRVRGYFDGEAVLIRRKKGFLIRTHQARRTHSRNKILYVQDEGAAIIVHCAKDRSEENWKPRFGEDGKLLGFAAPIDGCRGFLHHIRRCMAKEGGTHQDMADRYNKLLYDTGHIEPLATAEDFAEWTLDFEAGIWPWCPNCSPNRKLNSAFASFMPSGAAYESVSRLYKRMAVENGGSNKDIRRYYRVMMQKACIQENPTLEEVESWKTAIFDWFPRHMHRAEMRKQQGEYN